MDKNLKKRHVDHTQESTQQDIEEDTSLFSDEKEQAQK